MVSSTAVTCIKKKFFGPVIVPHRKVEGGVLLKGSLDLEVSHLGDFFLDLILNGHIGGRRSFESVQKHVSISFLESETETGFRFQNGNGFPFPKRKPVSVSEMETGFCFRLPVESVQYAHRVRYTSDTSDVEGTKIPTTR
jgi:hypothetical protein